jgi:hypothetical protein
LVLNAAQPLTQFSTRVGMKISRVKVSLGK